MRLDARGLAQEQLCLLVRASEAQHQSLPDVTSPQSTSTSLSVFSPQSTSTVCPVTFRLSPHPQLDQHRSSVHIHQYISTRPCPRLALLTESANKLPRLIVLVVTDTLAKNTKLVTNLKGLKEKGVVVIAVLAPGYRKPDPEGYW